MRKGSRVLEPLDIKSERVESRLYEDGDEDEEGEECKAVAPDVKDTCVQTQDTSVETAGWYVLQKFEVGEPLDHA